jgi:hypothetical protein
MFKEGAPQSRHPGGFTMNGANFSFYILGYNFVIGILLMLASEKIGFYAGRCAGLYKEKTARFTQIGTFTFGACAAVISAGVYLLYRLSL